jgi:hypothetical protein
VALQTTVVTHFPSKRRIAAVCDGAEGATVKAADGNDLPLG